MTTSRPRSPAEPFVGGGPRRRPPLAVRATCAVLGAGAGLFSAALLLSDRAPGVLRTLLGDRVNRLWERIDRAGAPVVIGSEARSQPDFVVHLLIWAVIATLVGLAVWSWRALPFAAGVVALSSIAVELAQGRWSSTRSVERSDALANLLGVATGAVVAAATMLVWSTVAVAFGSRPRGREAP